MDRICENCQYSYYCDFTSNSSDRTISGLRCNYTNSNTSEDGTCGFFLTSKKYDKVIGGCLMD